MADTSVIEVARSTHEEIERYEQAVVDLLLSGPSTSTSTSSSTSATAAAATPATTAAPVSLLAHKLSLQREHKISELLDRIVNRKAQLRSFYQDETRDRAKELAILTQTPAAGSAGEAPSDALSEFHERLAKVHEFHAKYPQAAPEAFAVDFSALESDGLPRAGAGSAATAAGPAATGDFVDRMFSGEEMLGKYLDMNSQHEMFLNLKGVRKVPYVVYLDQFDQLVGPEAKVPVQTKKAGAYREYLGSLRDYLAGFLRKTRPLSDVDAIERGVNEVFESRWQEGKVEGWSKFGPVAALPAPVSSESAGQAADPNGNPGPAALNQGIWCPACRRMYSKQSVYDAHLKSSKHEKAAARLAVSQGQSQGQGQGGTSTPGAGAVPDTSGLGSESKWRTLALLEQHILAYGKVFDGIRQETKSNIERRAALTEREREAEAEAAEAALQASGKEAEEEVREEDEGEGEERMYNPLRLPLGWDGKPIPFWQFKLHGLGVEYKCQICSDYVYQGRRAFEKHFRESRHAFGMRALGLPNTKHFFEITEIADALACTFY